MERLFNADILFTACVGYQLTCCQKRLFADSTTSICRGFVGQRVVRHLDVPICCARVLDFCVLVVQLGLRAVDKL